MYPLVTDVFLRLKAPYQKVSCSAAGVAVPVLPVAAQLLLVPASSHQLCFTVRCMQPKTCIC